ncbi:MAG: hypothetical protein LBB91_02935 [Clostridiales bacterium]|jgi:hypothetical protein|nr:hypothetical protein [Clostridiales bacterium]
MSLSKPISAGDPQAVAKLTKKKQECIELQEHMKAVNAYWRKTGTCLGAPDITKTQAIEMDRRIAKATLSWESVPFSDYSMKNNNAEIKRLENRIAEISRNREVGFSGWDFDGGYAEANTEMNRLQLFFDEKPSDSQRAQLKSHGFKWAPSQGAWQRQLNGNAIYAAGRLDFIKPSDGRTVREHQPKAPVRDNAVR